MAKEYIEREALFAEFDRLGLGEHSFIEKVFSDGVRVIIEGMPAADVAPVVQGEWICVDTDDEQFFLCNRCKKKEYWESNYCPNCGARMDGDER